MPVRHLLAAAFFLVSAPAFADEGADATARAAAIAACSSFNAYGPVTVEAATQDGMGDWMVWLSDKDGDLWMCDANGDGNVYLNVMMQGDLLKGDGGAVIESGGGDGGAAAPGPASRAEELCLKLGAMLGAIEIAATTGDGVGDYLVWLKMEDESYIACNASADAKLYAFEPVTVPLDGEAQDDKPAPGADAI